MSPPAPQRLNPAGWDDLAARTVSGAYHVHTTRSDGHADRGGVAGEAARAGLKFVILTDHGDGTRPPDPPMYIDGVLVLDAVEISTDSGHYVALDMPRAPYPLAGAGEAVVEDVRRLGGFGIAAHPDSPKPALRWTSTARPDGVEWLNLDSEWRDETRWNLLRAGAAYVVRRGPALAMVLDRPSTLDARWASLLAGGRSVALAAADAHGGAGRRQEDPGRSVAGTIGIPSYGASFRAFSNRVILDRPLSGDAAADARAIYGAIRKGSVFSAIDALAAPALLDFTVEAGFDRAGMGAVLPADSDATLIARAVAPAGSHLSIVRNGRVMTSTQQATELRHVVTGGAGAYRVEILAPGAPGLPPIPWVVSNAIYFGDPADAVPPEQMTGPAPAAVPLGPAIAPFPWRIEKDPSSSATLRTTETQASLEYKLGDGPRGNQFVAIATDLQRSSLSRIQLSLAGDRPLRVSVQLRAADGGRWGRSYYVDPAGSALDVPVTALTAIGEGTGTHSPVTAATSLLLVIDLTNAQPGRAGTLHVRSSALIQ